MGVSCGKKDNIQVTRLSSPHLVLYDPIISTSDFDSMPGCSEFIGRDFPQEFASLRLRMLMLSVEGAHEDVGTDWEREQTVCLLLV